MHAWCLLPAPLLCRSPLAAARATAASLAHTSRDFFYKKKVRPGHSRTSRFDFRRLPNGGHSRPGGVTSCGACCCRAGRAGSTRGGMAVPSATFSPPATFSPSFSDQPPGRSDAAAGRLRPSLLPWCLSSPGWRRPPSPPRPPVLRSISVELDLSRHILFV
jgi:hypothetical protein